MVEVELAGHSLEQHVLPQVRCFRYGEPDQTCASSLLRAFNFLSKEQAKSLLMYVPRFVAVIGNIRVTGWEAALKALEVQYLNVSVYQNKSGRSAHEVEGRLIARTESLGFARFSAIDCCLRINRGCGLPLGTVQIIDQFGTSALWTVREASGSLWISKDRGPPLLEHESYVQILRTFDGRISLHPSAVQPRSKEHR